jgi:spore coat protein A
MMPGEVTRIVATFNRPGRYVWRCRILAHEHHRMMRPSAVWGIEVGMLPTFGVICAGLG